MDIQTSKIQLVKMILNIENDQFIEKLINFIKNETTDFWDELNLEEQEEIEKGLKELDNKNRIDFSDFLKKIS